MPPRIAIASAWRQHLCFVRRSFRRKSQSEAPPMTIFLQQLRDYRIYNCLLLLFKAAEGIKKKPTKYLSNTHGKFPPKLAELVNPEQKKGTSASSDRKSRQIYTIAVIENSLFSEFYVPIEYSFLLKKILTSNAYVSNFSSQYC